MRLPSICMGSIGPSCAIADVTSDRVTVWSGTQTPYGLREAIAKFLGLESSKVRLIFAEAAGCYGQNGADDVVIDAVVMSQAVGRPVRVQWMRADETGWETYKTARVSDLRAGLDAAGNIVAWESAAWGFSGYSRPEYHEPRHGGDPGSLVDRSACRMGPSPAWRKDSTVSLSKPFRPTMSPTNRWCSTTWARRLIAMGGDSPAHRFHARCWRAPIICSP